MSDWAWEHQRRRAILWAPVLFGLGILLWYRAALKPEPLVMVLLAAPFLGLLALPLAREALHWLLVAGLALCAGALVAVGHEWWQGESTDAPLPRQLEGRIIAIDQRAGKPDRLTLDLLRDGAGRPIAGLVRVTHQPPLHLRIGDIIRAHVQLQRPRPAAEAGAYDFAFFAAREGIVATGRAHRLTIIGHEPRGLWWRQWRQQIAERIMATVPGEAGAVIAALTVGHRGNIPEKVLDELRDSNLAHLLSISGLHMVLVTASIFALLRLLVVLIARERLPAKKLAAMGALLAGAFYLGLSGGDAPQQRAFIMVAVALGAVLLDRQPISLRGLALAALIVLLLRPYAVLEPGFQMSFAATLALVAGYEVLGPWLRRQPQQAWHMRALWWVAGLVLGSLLAGSATAPYAIEHFNRSTRYGLLANILAGPVMAFWVMPAAILAAALAPFGLDGWGWQVMAPGVEIVLQISAFVAGLPGAAHDAPSGWLPGFWVLNLGFLALCLWRGRWRWGGAVVLVLGLAMWQLPPRPEVLVVAEGRSMNIGIMTDGGRAVTIPKAFSSQLWRERDGAPQPNPDSSLWQADSSGWRWVKARSGVTVAIWTAKTAAAPLPEALAALGDGCGQALWLLHLPSGAWRDAASQDAGRRAAPLSPTAPNDAAVSSTASKDAAATPAAPRDTAAMSVTTSGVASVTPADDGAAPAPLVGATIAEPSAKTDGKPLTPTPRCVTTPRLPKGQRRYAGSLTGWRARQ